MLKDKQPQRPPGGGFAAAESGWLAWAAVLLISVVGGLAAWSVAHGLRQGERLAILDSQAEQLGIELMAKTLNGNLMGATALLGLIDEDVKREALGTLAPNGAKVTQLLKGIARAGESDGGFVVGQDGIIKSSFGLGKSSTGADIRFRPYYKSARDGKTSVYAAIGTTTGLPTLYFAAPVYAGDTPDTAAIGAVVARGNMEAVNRLLTDKVEIALLLSPQGVVFAANRASWVGFLAGRPSDERLREIRDLKQFGTLFDRGPPSLLPVQVERGIQDVQGVRYGVSGAAVRWNDPLGDWQLVLMEDLSRTVPAQGAVSTGLLVTLALLGILTMGVKMLQGGYARQIAARQLAAFAQDQTRLAESKAQLAAAALRLQECRGREELARVFLKEAHDLLGALQGALYVVETGQAPTLRLAASYACAALPPAELAFGEGLLGEAARRRRLQVIELPDDGTWQIRSGLGGMRPAAAVFLPVLLQDDLLCVVELGLAVPPGDSDLDQLQGLAAMLAMGLEIERRNLRGQQLLSEKAAAEHENERLAELERFARLAEGREERILELKHEINRLVVSAGGAEPYRLDAAEADDAPLPAADRLAEGEAARAQPPGLAELVDIADLQTLFTDFCEAIGIAAAIIDLEGRILAAARWQRVCTDFHRTDPRSCARCVESDTELASRLGDGADFTMYRCKNGMTDCAAPIIVDHRHLANVFIGQFHPGPPDHAFFKEMAGRFDFAEADYLRAVDEAPVIDEKRLPAILGCLAGFARMIASMALARRRADEAQAGLEKQAEILRRERRAAISLAEDAEKARSLLAAATEAGS